MSDHICTENGWRQLDGDELRIGQERCLVEMVNRMAVRIWVPDTADAEAALPTVPHTVVRVTWGEAYASGDELTGVLTLHAKDEIPGGLDYEWAGPIDQWTTADLQKAITGYEVLAAPNPEPPLSEEDRGYLLEVVAQECARVQGMISRSFSNREAGWSRSKVERLTALAEKLGASV